MNETIQLLQDVIRNGRTGESAIDDLLKKVAVAVAENEALDASKNAG